MTGISQNILYKSSAFVVIAGTLLCVLFGNGIHIHSVFSHLFDHGHLHAVVHAHPVDSQSSHDHATGYDGNEDHQHPTATVELSGTLTQRTINKVFLSDIELIPDSALLNEISFTDTSMPWFSDLPPPDPLFSSGYFSSYSLRDPPLG